jgi:hypothetical protein
MKVLAWLGLGVALLFGGAVVMSKWLKKAVEQIDREAL